MRRYHLNEDLKEMSGYTEEQLGKDDFCCSEQSRAKVPKKEHDCEA